MLRRPMNHLISRLNQHGLQAFCSPPFFARVDCSTSWTEAFRLVLPLSTRHLLLPHDSMLLYVRVRSHPLLQLPAAQLVLIRLVLKDQRTVQPANSICLVVVTVPFCNRRSRTVSESQHALLRLQPHNSHVHKHNSHVCNSHAMQAQFTRKASSAQ